MPEDVAPEDRIFLTLDFDSQFDDIRHLVTDMGDRVHALKLGPAFYLHPRGHDIQRFMLSKGLETMYDAKYDEVPDLMAPVVAKTMELGHRYVSVAPLAGRSALIAAAKEQGESRVVAAFSSRRQLDSDEVDVVKKVNRSLPPEQRISNVICNVQFVPAVRRRLGEEVCVIATGIRMEGDLQHGQPYVATPAEAIGVHGADRIAIGRSITGQSGVNEQIAAYERVLENLATDI